MAGETSRFHWVDYFVLALMLLFSSIIGLYFAFAGKKAIQRNKTTGELFLGGRGLTLFPVTMSVTASFVSGNYLLWKLLNANLQIYFVILHCSNQVYLLLEPLPKCIQMVLSICFSAFHISLHFQ